MSERPALYRHEIRRLALEHFLTEWQSDGWEVDFARGEVVVGGSWFPVEALPHILLNHMGNEREAAEKAKVLALDADRINRDSLAETLSGTGVTANTWQSAARRLASENRLLRVRAAETDPRDWGPNAPRCVTCHEPGPCACGHLDGADYIDCTCGHDIDGHGPDGCFPACGCTTPGPDHRAANAKKTEDAMTGVGEERES